MSATKTARVQLRLNDADDVLLRRAAEAVGESVTDFMTRSAVERAQEVLADQRHFVLDANAWDAFVAAIETPAAPNAALVDLFSRPRRIER